MSVDEAFQTIFILIFGTMIVAVLLLSLATHHEKIENAIPPIYKMGKYIDGWQFPEPPPSRSFEEQLKEVMPLKLWERPDGGHPTIL